MKLKDVYYILLGMLTFSRLGNWIVLELIGFPFYFAEIFFLPVLFINKTGYRTYIKETVQKSPFFIILLLYLLLINIVGALTSENIYASLELSRSIFYIAILFSVYSQNISVLSVKSLKTVVFGGVAGQLVYALFMNEKDFLVPLFFVFALAIIIPTVKRQFLQSLMMFSICFVVSLLSGYRIPLLIILIAGITCIIYTLFHLNTVKKVFFGPLVLAASVFISAKMILNYDQIVIRLAEIFHLSSTTIYRILYKMDVDFLMLQRASGHSYRDWLSFPLDIFRESVFPRGISLWSDGIYRYGYYTDNPIIILYDLFGSAVGWAITILIMYMGARAFLKAMFHKNDRMFDIMALMFPAVLVAFVINGSFAFGCVQPLILGIVLGYWNKKAPFDSLKGEIYQ